MKAARPIALWLATAIVMIAAALMSSGAQAHEGHAHPGHAVSVAQAAAPSVPDAAASAGRPLPALARSTMVVELAAVEASGLACACPACAAGGACGHASSSCCATGLAPSSVIGLSPPGRADRAPARDGPPLSGIVPEAQTEPPRPLA